MVAFVFIIIGIVGFLGGAGIGGLWTAFIGWFLLEAAGASRAQIETSAALRNVRAADLLERDCLVVDGHENLETFVNDYLLRTGKNCFLVQNGQGIEGIIPAFDLRKIDRAGWPNRTGATPTQRLHQPRSV